LAGHRQGRQVDQTGAVGQLFAVVFDQRRVVRAHAARELEQGVGDAGFELVHAQRRDHVVAVGSGEEADFGAGQLARHLDDESWQIVNLQIVQIQNLREQIVVFLFFLLDGARQFMFFALFAFDNARQFGGHLLFMLDRTRQVDVLFCFVLDGARQFIACFFVAFGGAREFGNVVIQPRVLLLRDAVLLLQFGVTVGQIFGFDAIFVELNAQVVGFVLQRLEADAQTAVVLGRRRFLGFERHDRVVGTFELAARAIKRGKSGGAGRGLVGNRKLDRLGMRRQVGVVLHRGTAARRRLKSLGRPEGKSGKTLSNDSAHWCRWAQSGKVKRAATHRLRPA